jgi:hypothetical protein
MRYYGSGLTRVGVPLIIVMLLLPPTVCAVLGFTKAIAPYVVGAIMLFIVVRLTLAYLQRW